MQTFVHFRAFEHRLGAERVDRLIQLHPQGKKGRSFQLRLSEDDPVAQSVLNELKVMGLTPWTDHTRSPDYSKEIAIQRYRVFSDTEIAEAKFLVAQPKSRIDVTGRSANGLITIPKYKLEGTTAIGRAQSLGTWIVLVSSTARRGLEKAGLSRMAFRPTQLLDFVRRGNQELGPIPWDDFGEPWHQLQSDVFMPWVCPPTYTVDAREQTVQLDSPAALFYKESGFDDFVLYYDRDEVELLGVFDIALTRERLGGEDDRLPIVSRKFRECCEQMGLKCTWRPIVFG